jgi:hypothetical protein
MKIQSLIQHDDLNDDLNDLPEERAEDRLDHILHTELQWQAPPDLTNRLLSSLALEMAPAAPTHAVLPAAAGEIVDTPPLAEQLSESVLLPPLHPQPSKWYSAAVILLTSIAVTLSCSIAWEFYGTVLSAWWAADIQQPLAMSMQHLYQEIPASRSVVDFLQGAYNQTHWMLSWVLVAVALWFALDGYSPSSSNRHLQEQHSS